MVSISFRLKTFVKVTRMASGISRISGIGVPQESVYEPLLLFNISMT